MKFSENKNIARSKGFKAVIFALFFVFSFGLSSKVAHAGYCYCFEVKRDPSMGTAINSPKDENSKKVFDNISDKNACNDKCNYAGYYFFSQVADEEKSKDIANYRVSISSQDNPYYQKTMQQANDYADKQQKKDVCSTGGSLVSGDFEEAFKCILYSVLQGLGWLLSIVATLFQWAVDPVNISGNAGMLNSSAVKNIWIMVRDTLNMTFILILLFAAFCTVFQVDNWNLQKVWLGILINSLLVNFSFPIARIFIDISNVAMYYFLNHLFTGSVNGGSGIMAMFAGQSQISTLLLPNGYANATTTYILAAIIFTFILGITLLVLAGLFIIRLIALTMILMFSPIGFVGYIFPGTKNFASQWWDNLFKYAFFGPIMVFMMMVAIAIMKAAPSSFIDAASKNTIAGIDNKWIGTAAYYFIPISVLWMAMGISQKMGVEGASVVVGKGQQFAKKVGGWVRDLPMRGVKAGWQATGIPGGVKKGWENTRKTGKLFGKNVPILKDGREDRESGFTGIMKDGKGGWSKAQDKIKEKKNKDDIKDEAEKVEGAKSMTVLRNEIKNSIANPPVNDDDKKKYAINAKIALGRGAKYEKEIEDDTKAVMYADRANVDLRNIKSASLRAARTLEGHDANKPGPLNAGASASRIAEHTAKMADWSATRSQLKDKLDKAKKELEIEEKKIIQKAKTDHLEALRKALQTGEDIGKRNPR